MKHTSLLLLDDDSRRRAAVVHKLSAGGIHAEPFESISELMRHGPRPSETVLAYDNDKTLATLLEEMAKEQRVSPLIGYCEQPETRQVVCAVKDGVDDYITWPFSVADVESSLGRVVERGSSLRSSKSRQITARSRLERLSGRERQVLVSLADGSTNRAIAERLGISSRTVEIHRSNAIKKMHASHSSEAIRVVIEANLSD